MDIYCPRCGEPIDTGELHEEVDARIAHGEEDATFDRVFTEYQTSGCKALAAYLPDAICEVEENPSAKAARLVYEEFDLGLDVDAISSEITTIINSGVEV